MTIYAQTVRRELLAHRDGAKAFSGTTFTDPDLIRQQESTFASLTHQGFTLANATRGLVLVHDFTIGFCVEEQAVVQAKASGDERYSLDRRAEMIGEDIAPLAVEAGWVIFGEPDTRFAELVGVLLSGIDQLRGDG
jgi:TetR/AcrR family transcriptional regulator, tetracycline repressor protein